MDILKHLMTREHALGITIHRAYTTRTESEVGPYLRDKAMRWIRVLNENLNFIPETFALAVHIFDTFLLRVKVKKNHLRCVAITAYFLSIKTVEEDENIPLIAELLEASQCGCRKADVLKMEQIILLTIAWKIPIATPLTFLRQVYQLLRTHITDFENISKNILSDAEDKLLECMCKWQLTQFRWSVLALAVLELKLKGILDQNSLLLQKIRQIVKIDPSELTQCQILIKAYEFADDKNKPFCERTSKVDETSLSPLIQEKRQHEIDQTTKPCLVISEEIKLDCKIDPLGEKVEAPSIPANDIPVTVLQEKQSTEGINETYQIIKGIAVGLA